MLALQLADQLFEGESMVAYEAFKDSIISSVTVTKTLYGGGHPDAMSIWLILQNGMYKEHLITPMGTHLCKLPC